VIEYKYKCPVCEILTGTSEGMFSHLEDSIRTGLESHLDWITERLPSTMIRNIKNGEFRQYRKPLVELVEKECKIEE
jgi:hypothetical protein